MDPIKIGHISNADIYLNNNSLVGRVKEFDPGDLSIKMISHEALGMIGVLELPSRSHDAIKAKITFDFLDHELERQMLNPTKLHRLALHSYVDVFGSEGLDRAKSHRLVSTLGFFFASRSGMGHTLGEMVNHEHEISVPMITQKISTEETPIIEYDIFAGIHRVNGENVWPD